jgi:SAM-dependent methyltransferase
LVKFEKILELLGYKDYIRLPIRPKTHVSQYYRSGDLFFKFSLPNKNIKTLKEEYEVILALNLSFIPKVHSYKKFGNIELIVMDFVSGDIISENTYFKGLENVILEQIRAVFNRGFVHGDIKLDSFIVSGRDVYMIDFNRSYRLTGNVSFESSPDMCGNHNSPRWDPSNFKYLMRKISLIKENVVRDITNEPWMKGFISTGSDKPYYTWTGNYFRVHGHRTDERPNIIRTKLPRFFKDKVVADIGCNIGMMSHLAVELGARKVTGFEICGRTAEAAKRIVELEKLENITIICCDLGKEEIVEECDIALCFSALHHINPKDKIFAFLNDKVRSSILLEEHHREQSWGSKPISGQEWYYGSVREMLDHLCGKHLTNFVVAEHLGLATDTIRPRNMYRLDRNI